MQHLVTHYAVGALQRGDEDTNTARVFQLIQRLQGDLPVEWGRGITGTPHESVYRLRFLSSQRDDGLGTQQRVGQRFQQCGQCPLIAAASQRDERLLTDRDIGGFHQGQQRLHGTSVPSGGQRGRRRQLHLGIGIRQQASQRIRNARVGIQCQRAHRRGACRRLGATEPFQQAVDYGA